MKFQTLNGRSLRSICATYLFLLGTLIVASGASTKTAHAQHLQMFQNRQALDMVSDTSGEKLLLIEVPPPHQTSPTGRRLVVRNSETNTESEILSGRDVVKARFSRNGRYVVYSDSLPQSASTISQVLVLDLTSGTSVVASQSASGVMSNFSSGNGVISSDGRYVVFTSSATNLLDGEGLPTYPALAPQVYRKDLITGEIRRISSGANGAPANETSAYPEISADASRVVFSSLANNLSPEDSDPTLENDIFLYSAENNSLRLLNQPLTPESLDSSADTPSISADGERILNILRTTENLGGILVLSRRAVLHQVTTGVSKVISTSKDDSIQAVSVRIARINDSGDTIAFATGPGRSLLDGASNNNETLYVKRLSDGAVSELFNTELISGLGYSSVRIEPAMVLSENGSKVLFGQSARLSGSYSTIQSDAFLGIVGCGREFSQIAPQDSDLDGQNDCSDRCSNDPTKFFPDQCACGQDSSDTDRDQTPMCMDVCPTDKYKSISAGACGCNSFESLGAFEEYVCIPHKQLIGELKALVISLQKMKFSRAKQQLKLVLAHTNMPSDRLEANRTSSLEFYLRQRLHRVRSQLRRTPTRAGAMSLATSLLRSAKEISK